MAAMRERFGLSLLFAWAGGLAKSLAERYLVLHDHAFCGLRACSLHFSECAAAKSPSVGNLFDEIPC